MVAKPTNRILQTSPEVGGWGCGCGIWSDIEGGRGFSLPLPGRVLAKTG